MRPMCGRRHGAGADCVADAWLALPFRLRFPFMICLKKKASPLPCDARDRCNVWGGIVDSIYSCAHAGEECGTTNVARAMWCEHQCWSTPAAERFDPSLSATWGQLRSPIPATTWRRVSSSSGVHRGTLVPCPRRFFFACSTSTHATTYVAERSAESTGRVCSGGASAIVATTSTCASEMPLCRGEGDSTT